MFSSFTQLFHIDPLGLVMGGLVSFLSLSIALFSTRYLAGDRRIRHYFVYTALLFCSLMATFFVDFLPLFLLFWAINNFLLYKLMVHKKEWRAAKNSGLFALKNSLLSCLFLGSGLTVLLLATKEFSLHAIFLAAISPTIRDFALIMIALAALTQSAVWPFHRWLISSLNSPTPVSALMHAGLVNGGGFLLARFAPLFFHSPWLLSSLFLLGLVCALLGNLWKLFQSDVKRMLACSTMGQMGFMVMQCGLGLFAGAITHLIWHGVFKAYLFLSTASVVEEPKKVAPSTPSWLAVLCAMLCGSVALVAFSTCYGSSLFESNTMIFMHLIVFALAFQIFLPLFRSKSFIRFIIGLVAAASMGALYAIDVLLIKKLLAPMHLMQPQPMNLCYWLGFSALLLFWLAVLFSPYLSRKKNPPRLWLSFYMAVHNMSQPYASTVTTHRNHYRYR